MLRTKQNTAEPAGMIYTLVIIQMIFTGCVQQTKTLHPTVQDITISAYASGKVKSNTQYQVFSPVNGLVQKRFVSKGDPVKKDAVLIRLQNTTASITIDNARLSAANAAISANTDKLNELISNIGSLKNKYQNDSVLYVRQQNLWASGIGTRNELEQRELQYKNDRITFEAAIFHLNDLERQVKFGEAQSKNNLRISKAVANDCLIKSDLDGQVFDIFVKEGEMVTTQTPLALIGGSNDFILELQVDEYDISNLRVGQKVLYTMDSYKNSVFGATLSKIIPLMNERTRTFTVEARLTDAPPVLYPNLTVDANIITGIRNNVITIPREYLTEDTMVILKNGKRQRVTTGVMDYTRAEIVAGLTKNDIIVKPGQ